MGVQAFIDGDRAPALPVEVELWTEALCFHLGCPHPSRSKGGTQPEATRLLKETTRTVVESHPKSQKARL